MKYNNFLIMFYIWIDIPIPTSEGVIQTSIFQALDVKWNRDFPATNFMCIFC